MKRKGFTLIELMITLSIFAIFIGFVYNTYFAEISMSNKMSSAYNAEVNAKNVIKAISNSIIQQSKTEDLIITNSKTIQVSSDTRRIDKIDNATQVVTNLVTFDTQTKKLKIIGKPDIDCISQGISDIAFSKTQDSNIIEITVNALDKYGDFQLKTGINIYD